MCRRICGANARPCQQMIFHKDLDANLKVCPHCGHHMRPSALERLAWTFDDGRLHPDRVCRKRPPIR